MAELPERTRVALEMHRFGGFKLREIAAHLGISVTVTHELIAAACRPLPLPGASAGGNVLVYGRNPPRTPSSLRQDEQASQQSRPRDHGSRPMAGRARGRSRRCGSAGADRCLAAADPANEAAWQDTVYVHGLMAETRPVHAAPRRAGAAGRARDPRSRSAIASLPASSLLLPPACSCCSCPASSFACSPIRSPPPRRCVRSPSMTARS